MTSERLIQAPSSSLTFDQMGARPSRFASEILRSKVISAINIAIGALASATLASCGGNPSGPGPAPNPTPVTQTIKALTSDGRTLGTTTYTGNANEPLTIRLTDLAAKGLTNLSTIDQNYAALRKDNTEDNRVGAAVTNTTTGILTYTPTASETLILWGMNKTNGTDYTCAANTPGFITQGFRNNQRYAAVQRLTPTNNTVPEFAIVEGDTIQIQAGLPLLNQAWTANGIQYASLTWTADNPGDIKGGLGTHKTLPLAAAHIGSSYYVNPLAISIEQRNFSAMEAIETHFMYNDLCGKNSTDTLLGNIQAQILTVQGKDYMRFGALMKRQ